MAKQFAESFPFIKGRLVVNRLTRREEFHSKHSSVTMRSVAVRSVHDLFCLKPASCAQSLEFCRLHPVCNFCCFAESSSWSI